MNSSRQSNGFTLVELLVVIAILAILLGLLFPLLRPVKERALDVKCKGKQRQIGMAMINFCVDHEGTMPGGYRGSIGSEPWQKEWIGKEVWIPGAQLGWWMENSNRFGTLSEYTGTVNWRRDSLYRCPALAQDPFFSGTGSNGLFDYPYVKIFAGARTSAIPTSAVLYRGTDMARNVRTPVFAEEDPALYLNTSNIDPGHSNRDRLGTWHPGGSGNYVAIDGSSQSIKSEGLGPTTWNWSVQMSSGQLRKLGWVRRYGAWSNAAQSWY